MNSFDYWLPFFPERASTLADQFEALLPERLAADRSAAGVGRAATSAVVTPSGNAARSSPTI